VAAYLAEHPGSRAKQIADTLGVELAAISSHLYRGKGKRFQSAPDGWYAKDDG
jgi:predicted transcriptional regulator